MKNTTAKLFSAPLAGVVALGGAAAMTLPAAAQAEVTGNLSVVSEYLFRGAYENNGTSVQGGLDYAHESGLYVGYWGASLDYGDASSSSGFENDVYLGYSGSAGDVSYDVGLLYFFYNNVDDADTPEFYASLGYGPFSVGMAYLMDDVAWGNEGDIYWSLGYETDLPMDFGFAATVGYYTYSDDDVLVTTTENSGLKHVDLTLSHPLGETGADMTITYMIGGKDRTDADVEDTVILGVHYGF